MKISPISSFNTGINNPVKYKNNSFLHTVRSDSVTFGNCVQNASGPIDISRLGEFWHNPIEVVFSDIDGTILYKAKGAYDTKIVPPQNTEAVKMLKANGVVFPFITSRSYKETLPVFESLDMEPGDAVVQQGAEIHLNGDVIRYTMDRESTEKIIKVIETYREKHDKNVHLMLYFGDDGYGTYPIDYNSHHVQIMKQAKSFDDLLNQKLLPVKAFIMKTNAKEYNDMAHVIEYLDANLLSGNSSISGVQSSSRFYEITSTESSKAGALKEVADKLGINMENIAVIGDGDNDAKMLEYVKEAGGLSIVLGDGTEKAKKAAGFITKNVADAGFAYAIDEMLKNNTRLNEA